MAVESKLMQEKSQETLALLIDKFKVGQGLSLEEQLEQIGVIEKLQREDAVLILNHIVKLENDPVVLYSIVKTIGKFNDKSSACPLIDLLLWKENCAELLKSCENFIKVRCLVAKVLGNIKNHSAVVPLLYILNNKDENYKLRLAAADALGIIGDRFAVAPLIDLVVDEDEKSVYVRESAAKALGMIGDMSAIDPLVNLLEAKKGIVDKFTFLKERAIEAIGRLGFKDDRTFKVLTHSLMDESSQVRINAIEALSDLDDERVLPLIQKMLFDEEEEVARTAVIALYNILGREFLEELLLRDDVAGWCKDEAETIIEEDEDDENDEDGESNE
ncbi:MAG: HEAT repeat domain-containing protein [bacterium]